jgi:hypothetical protein
VFLAVGWGLVTSAWGANIVGNICDNLELHLLLRCLHPVAKLFMSKSLLQGQSSPLEADIVVSSIWSLDELHQLGELLQLLRPKITIISSPCHNSR